MTSILRQLILGVGLLAALWAYHAFTQWQLSSARAEAAAQTTRADNLSAELAAAKTDARIVTKYVDRVHTVHEKGATIVRRIPVYVPQTTVDSCTVNRGFVRVLNAAAASVDLPAGATAIDAQPAGIGLDTVAGSVVDNYTTANAIREQLIALQSWVRAHSAPASAASTGPP